MREHLSRVRVGGSAKPQECDRIVRNIMTSSTESSQGSSRYLALTLVLFVPFILLGCPGGGNKSADATSTNSASSPARTTSDFDGERAFEHVRKQVEFGPRPPGSAELEKTRGYLIDQLKSYGLQVMTDEFLEIARVMAASKTKPKLTYWFVFFDGEEALCFGWDDCHNPNPADPKKPLPDNTYGSRHYVAQLIDKSELKRVRAMILLDMIGYKNLRLGRDDLSTTWLQDIVWQTAKQIGYGSQFVDAREGVGDDDHGPFLRAGVDSLDIIQLSTYGVSDSEYWHTKEDTLDKISSKSLKVVGDAVIGSLPKIEERLASKR